MPEQGLQWRLAQRRWAPNREKSPDSVTSPRTVRPASAALPGTISGGARPIRPKIPRSPSRRHSGRSENVAAQRLAFECGSVTTGSSMSRGRPASTRRKLPKSTCAVPGAHSSPRRPSRGEAGECPDFHLATHLETDEYDPA